MAIEFRLASNCTHETLFERASLQTDRKTLSLSQPIASTNTVRIYADDLELPSVGLKSMGVLSTSYPGPFDLDPNSSVLYISYSQGEVILDLKLTSKKRYFTDDLISLIRKAGFKGAIENSQGCLVLYDSFKVGSGSFVHVSGSMSTLIFSLQQRSQGRDLFPAWRLFSKTPQFLSIVKNNTPLFVSYITDVENCLRCTASYVENDISFSQTGEPFFIDDEDHLYQATLKMLLTEKGSNSFFPWYGTSIAQRIGTKALGSTVAAITDEIRKGLSQYQKLQKEQSGYQTITAKERLYNILSVKVNPSDLDPRVFMVEVVIQNASSQPVKLDIVYTTPGVVALAGTNGLSLGTQRLGL
jgi:hypothetical protein